MEIFSFMLECSRAWAALLLNYLLFYYVTKFFSFLMFRTIITNDVFRQMYKPRVKPRDKLTSKTIGVTNFHINCHQINGSLPIIIEMSLENRRVNGEITLGKSVKKTQFFLV